MMKIDIRDNIPDKIAIELVGMVIRQGRISKKDNKMYYCWATKIPYRDEEYTVYVRIHCNMRTIKFRGKTLNQKWVYGDLLHYTNRSKLNEANNDSTIVIGYKSKSCNNFNIVIPETVGQFTGLLDKNGKEIYELDIVRKKEIGGYGLERVGVVRYYEKDCRFGIDFTATDKFWKRGLFIEGEAQMEDGHCTHTYTLEYEVLGNIFDNSELLKSL